MTRHLRTCLVLLLIALIAGTGCHPTQPFYLHEDGDLSHYLDAATDIEHPDVYTESLEDVQNAGDPLSHSNPDFEEIWDLDLEEAISIALQNSKVVRNLGGVTPFGFSDALIGRTGSASTVYDAAAVETDPNNGVEAALAAFDAQFSMLGSNNGNIFSRTNRPSQITRNSIVRRDSSGVQTEVSKRAATGTQFFVRNLTNWQRGSNGLDTGNNAPGMNGAFAGGLPDIWETQFELEVRHPLLRGRGTQINRIPVVLARINTDVTLATFEASIRNLALDIENTYWDLYCAYRNLDTAKRSRDSVLRLWQAESAKASGGTLGVAEEAQVRGEYFFFRSRLETAQQNLLDLENRLRFLMGIAASDGRLIRPIDEPTIAHVQFDWRLIHAEALTRSAELRQQKWTIKRREMELISARNQLLPQLDVGATYRWYGIGDNLISANRNGLNFVDIPGGTGGPENSNAFDVLTEGRYQEAALLFSFQMPVGYRRELAGVRNAQINLVRERARLEDMELNTSHLLTTSVRGLDYSYQLEQSSFNRWKASQQELESRATKLQLGGAASGDAGELDRALDNQRRLAEAEFEYYQNVCNYNKSIADVHFRKGSLLEFNNIMLAEGPWPEKAYFDAMGRARERDASYYMNYGWSRPKVVSQGAVNQLEGRGIPGEILDGNVISGSEIIEVPEGAMEPTPILPEEPPILPQDPTPAQLEDNSPSTLPTPAAEVPSTTTGVETQDIPAPAAQPEPALEAPAPEGERRGPVTNRPEGPTLNAPRRAASGGPARSIAGSEETSSPWAGLKIGNKPVETSNPLRKVSHQDAP